MDCQLFPFNTKTHPKEQLEILKDSILPSRAANAALRNHWEPNWRFRQKICIFLIPFIMA
jgi:hypothetical protein